MIDISVIIPTFNRKEYLPKSIESCFGGNGSVRVEVIVVDNGSTDGTRDWLQALDDKRIRVCYEKTPGAPAARNRGLEAARGTFARFLDDDDWLTSGSLESAVQCLRDDDADICYGPIRTVSDTETSIDPLSDYEAPCSDLLVALLEEKIAYQTPRFTYRRSLVASERWDPDLPVRQDYDFVVAAALNNPKHKYCEGAGYRIRDHDGSRISNSYTGRDYFESQLRTARKVWDRVGSPISDQRRTALANRVWQIAHIAGAYDLTYTDAFLSLLREIEPTFTPQRRFLPFRLLDQCLGIRKVEHLISPFRRAKKRVQELWHP